MPLRGSEATTPTLRTMKRPWGRTPLTVLSHTGVEVTSNDIDVASSMIEVYAGLVGRDLSRWTESRLSWLARATDWQASFVKNNPSLFTAGVYQSVRADDVQQVFRQRGMIDMDRRAVTCMLQIGGQGRVRSLRTRGATGLTAGPANAGVEEDTEPDAELEWKVLDVGA